MDKLEWLLERAAIPQEELARALNVAPNRISKWKSGQGEPRARHVLAMARFFGVSVESLLDDTIEEPEPPARLSEKERALLTTARVIGLDEAILRITNAPRGASVAAAAEERDVPISWEEVPPQGRKRRKGRASG